MAKDFAFYKNEDETFDLDLAPVLSVVVALVPIFLATAVFIRIGVIETQLPQIINEAVQQERKDETPKTSVKVEVSNAQGFVVEVTSNGQVSKKTINLVNNDFDYAALHKELVEFKTANPMIFRLELRPTDDVPYNKIIKVMDSARKIQVGDPKLHVVDPKTNEKVESPYLFVDIFFGNVLEG